MRNRHAHSHADCYSGHSTSARWLAMSEPTVRRGELLASRIGAEERTRTSTRLPGLAPEASASANSATPAQEGSYKGSKHISIRHRSGHDLQGDSDDSAVRRLDRGLELALAMRLTDRLRAHAGNTSGSRCSGSASASPSSVCVLFLRAGPGDPAGRKPGRRPRSRAFRTTSRRCRRARPSKATPTPCCTTATRPIPRCSPRSTAPSRASTSKPTCSATARLASASSTPWPRRPARRRSCASCSIRSARRSAAKSTDRLKAAGAQLSWFNQLGFFTLEDTNYRTHRKTLVVDGDVAFTGGMGVADHWLGHAQDKEHWRDTQFRITGPAVRALEGSFYENWIESGGRSAPALDPELPPRGRPVRARSWCGATPWPAPATSSCMYLLAIGAARKTIDIQSPYVTLDASTLWSLDEARRPRRPDSHARRRRHHRRHAGEACQPLRVPGLLDQRHGDLRIPADDDAHQGDGRRRHLQHHRVRELRQPVVRAERRADGRRLRPRSSRRS